MSGSIQGPPSPPPRPKSAPPHAKSIYDTKEDGDVRLEDVEKDSLTGEASRLPTAPVNAAQPAPQKPPSSAGSVNMQAGPARDPTPPKASATITQMRKSAGAQILTIRYLPKGAAESQTPLFYEVALPLGRSGAIDETDHHALAHSLAKLIQTAEERSAKQGKALTSFTFTKPTSPGAPPALILVLDKGTDKDIVNLSEEADFKPSYLDESVHSELHILFDHLRDCLHAPVNDRVHAKITRLDKDPEMDAPNSES